MRIFGLEDVLVVAYSWLIKIRRLWMGRQHALDPLNDEVPEA